MRRVLLLALCGACLAVAAPASSVAPGKSGQIVFANGDPLGRGSILEVANADGTGAAKPLLVRAVNAAMPAVSPDGTRVAFASFAAQGGIDVLTLGTRAIARITRVAGDIDPAWSPDSKRLVFARRLPSGGHQLMSVPSTGGAAAKLAGALGRRPDFSPDGSQIVFQLDGKRSGIAVVPAAGGRLVSLGAGTAPSWSPDGQRIALAASVQGLGHLFVVAPDGSGRRDITRFTPVTQPSWSPDGTRLAYVTSTAAGTCCGIATVDATGSARVRVTHGLVFASRPSWLPAR
jgi:Tol biopolymer transport system component